MADFTPDELAAIGRAKASKVAAPQVAAGGDFTPDEQAAIARKASGPAPVAQPHADFMATVESMLAPLTKPRPQQPVAGLPDESAPTTTTAPATIAPKAKPTPWAHGKPAVDLTGSVADLDETRAATSHAEAAPALEDDSEVKFGFPTPRNIFHRVVAGGAQLATDTLGDTKLTRGLRTIAANEAMPSRPDAVDKYLNPKADDEYAAAGKKRDTAIAELDGRTPQDRLAAKNLPLVADFMPGDTSGGPKIAGVTLPNVVPERFREAMQQGKEHRDANAVDLSAGGAAQLLQNLGTSLYNVPAGLLEAANHIVGITARAPGESESEHAARFAHQLGQMPGQAADLARGLFDASGSNSLLVDPIGTYLTLVAPLTKSLEALSPKAAAKLRAASKPLVDTWVGQNTGKLYDKVRGHMTDEALPSAWANDTAAFKRWVADGILQGEERLTQIASDMTHGSTHVGDVVRNVGEMGARQIEQGKVNPIVPDLERTRLDVIPERIGAEQAKAERAQQAAETAAGRAGGRLDAARQAADEARALGRDVHGAQKQAVRAQGQIGKASADADAIVNSGPTQKRVTQMQRAGINAAVPGLKLADTVNAVDATTAPGMAREVANQQRQPARTAEAQAARAADEAQRAGIRPQVNVGDVYVPPDRAVGGRILAVEPGSGQVAPQVSLTEHLPEVAAVADAVLKGADDASRLQTVAIKAQFPADAPATQLPWMAKYNLPADATIYQAGRVLAEDIANRTVGKGAEGGPAGILTAALEQIGAGKGAAQAAQWLLAEVEAGKQAQRMHPAYGAMTRPTPVVEGFRVRADGSIQAKPEASAIRAADKAAGVPLEPAGAPRRAAQEMREMTDRQLVPEAPKPIMSDNPIHNEAARTIGEILRDSYGKSEKRLTPERFAQRSLEMLDGDTMQNVARSAELQHNILATVRDRAIASGMSKEAAQNLMAEFGPMLRDPALKSTHSKNRFPELTAENGTPLWTRADVQALQKATPKEKMQAIQADAHRQIVDEHAKAAEAQSTLVSIDAEVNRFRRDANGDMADATVGDVAGYAEAVAKGVLGNKEPPPLAMPFSGKAVSDALLADRVEIANRAGVPVERIDALARYLQRQVSAQEKIGESLKNYMNELDPSFKGTEIAANVINLADVHIDPGLAAALNGHFASRAAVSAIHGLGNLATSVGQHMKGSLVAKSVKALANNNVSNAMLQAINRADPMMIQNIVLDPLKFKAYLDGNMSRLTNAEELMFEAFKHTALKNGAQISRDIGQSHLWQSFGEVFGETKKSIERMNDVRAGKWERATDIINKPNDALAKAYTDLGDMPFRIEDMTASYKLARSEVDLLKPGEWYDLNGYGGKKVRVTRTPVGVELHEIGPNGAKPLGDFGMNSKELAKAIAQDADIIQEGKFFDLDKTGNIAKHMRSGPASLLSGIFSWSFRAKDLPFKMVEGAARRATSSDAVRAVQARRGATLAVSRALLAAEANAAMQDPEKLKMLRQSNDFNPAQMGAMLAQSTSPYGMNVRNIAPAIFTAPARVVVGGLEKLAAWVAYSDVMDDPQQLRELMLPDPDVMATKTPAERADIERNQGRLMRYALGQQFSLSQALQMLGAGGGPLLSVMEKMRAAEAGGRPFTLSDGRKEFGRAMFGATVSDVANIAMAGLGELGVDEGFSWSSYGKAEQRSGFKGGSADADQAGFLRWSMRQLIGMGWSEVYFGGGGSRDPATDSEFMGRATVYLGACQKVLTASMLAPAEQKARIAVARWNADKSEANEWAMNNAKSQYVMVKDTIKQEIGAMKQQLDNQFNRLHGRNTGTPQP